MTDEVKKQKGNKVKIKFYHAILVIMLVFVVSLCFSPRKTVAVPTDFNGDGKTDLRDLAVLAKAYGSHTNSTYDLVKDGVINIKDLIFLLKHFGSNCDLNNDNKINMTDLDLLSACFGSKRGDSRYNACFDLNGDEEINLLDLAILTKNFKEGNANE